MMKVFTKSSFLFFLFIISFSIPSNAVIDYKPDAEKKTTIIKKQKKAKKKGFLKKWREKFILRKISKEQSFKKKARLSLIIGIGSFLMAIAALVLLGAGSGAGFVFAGVAVISSIIGDFLSISILKKTKDSKEKYKKERKKAKWGLALSLSTLIVPLLSFLILLIVVIIMYA